MHSVGIDSIAFYTPNFYLDLADLAAARKLDVNKIHKSIGQYQSSILPPDEDVVTMGANAAHQALKNIDKETVSWVIFATESSTDQSKAGGLYIHELLQLPNQCRVIEFKQACYSATAAIQLAMPYIQSHPQQKVLLIAADNARYGLGHNAEPSQGCGAIAMVLSADPKLLSIEAGSGYHSENAMDFWRPNYRNEAIVDGKASSKLYLNTLEKSWRSYVENTMRQFKDHDQFCFHVPVSRLAENAFRHLCKVAGHKSDVSNEWLQQQMENPLLYNRTIGNCYSASLYLSLCSVLDNSQQDLTGKRLGLFSYGSGCVAEFFSMQVIPGYKEQTHIAFHQSILARRQKLSMEEYERFYAFTYPRDGSETIAPEYSQGKFRLEKISHHQSFYQNKS